MGTALLCFIMKGPRKLEMPGRGFNRAIYQTREMKKLLEEWLGSGDPDMTFKEFLNHAGHSRFELGCNTEALRDDAETYEIDHLAGIDPVNYVAKFIEFWNTKLGKPELRDLDFRTDPDDSSQIIVVAGETSWGDPPAGIGYNTLMDAYRLGITRELGIR